MLQSPQAKRAIQQTKRKYSQYFSALRELHNISMRPQSYLLGRKNPSIILDSSLAKVKKAGDTYCHNASKVLEHFPKSKTHLLKELKSITALKSTASSKKPASRAAKASKHTRAGAKKRTKR